MRISMLALINILREAFPNEQIVIENSKKKPLIRLKYFGDNQIDRLTYNTNTCTIFGVSKEWQKAIDDKIRKTKEIKLVHPDDLPEEDWQRIYGNIDHDDWKHSEFNRETPSYHDPKDRYALMQ